MGKGMQRFDLWRIRRNDPLDWRAFLRSSGFRHLAEDLIEIPDDGILLRKVAMGTA
ncbi:hypothetical protein Holit_03419 [Hollandina sp. SP2]